MSITAGSRNQKGFVNGLDRKGFTPDKCGAEILANSSDAFADKVIINVTQDTISVVDIGSNGMTTQKLEYMFDAGRENHEGDKSMGVSGIGGLISNYQWSKRDDGQPSQVIVYTKHKDDIYLKAVAPWDTIYKDKIYDGRITIEPMTDDEIHHFVAERNNRADATGTTIRFPYSEKINSLLESQFKKIQTECCNLDKLWSVIFGKINMTILLNKHDGLPPIELKKYDYFGGPEVAYYEGKFSCDIYCFIENGKKRFVCKNPEDDSQFIEITPIATGFSKEPRIVKVDTRKIDSAHTIRFTSGMIKDNNVFDPKNPKEPKAEFHLNGYDASFMKSGQQKDVIKEWASRVPIYRNNQRITSIPLDGFKVSSARAGGESLLKIVLHRAEISYDTDSKQENILDNLHGIQENKNQNQNDLPKQYTRLIEYLKNYHYEKIRTYFKNVIETHKLTKIEQQLQRKRDEQQLRQLEEIQNHQVTTEEGECSGVVEEILLKIAECESLTCNEVNDHDGYEHDDHQCHHNSSNIDDDNHSQCHNEEYDNNDNNDNNENNNEEENIPEMTEYDCSNSIISPEKTDNYYDEHLIHESKHYVLKLIQALSEHVASPNYNHTNGKSIYEYVLNHINN